MGQFFLFCFLFVFFNKQRSVKTDEGQSLHFSAVQSLEPEFGVNLAVYSKTTVAAPSKRGETKDPVEKSVISLLKYHKVQ